MSKTCTKGTASFHAYEEDEEEEMEVLHDCKIYMRVKFNSIPQQKYSVRSLYSAVIICDA